MPASHARILARLAGRRCLRAIAAPARRGAPMPVEPTADTTRYVAPEPRRPRPALTALSQDGADRFAMVPLARRSPFDRLVRDRGHRDRALPGRRRPHGAGVRRRAGRLRRPGPAARAARQLLGRARGRHAGAPPRPRSAAAPTLRAVFPVPANDCAALRPGTSTVDLDRATLLPLRAVTRRPGSPPGGAADAGPPRRRPRSPPGCSGRCRPARRRGRRVDQGFRRTSPAARRRAPPLRPAAARRRPGRLRPGRVRVGAALGDHRGRRGRSRPGPTCSRRCTPAAGSAWS